MTKFSKFLLIFALIIASCSSEDDGTGDNNGGDTGNETATFDRGAMLANWADNIIVPSFENFQGSTQSLQGLSEAFVASPSLATLEALRAQYKEAYLDFQTVSMFQSGMAEELNFRGFLNTYPANKAGVDAKLASGDFNLQLPSSFAEQGFPALDYLLYGLGSDEETLQLFSENENHTAYLLAVTERINSLTAAVTNSWKGEYRDTFVNNTSSSSTGSVDRFTNDYVMYFEKILRSGKIGYPAGAFTGSPSPGNAEALYASGLSKSLYLKAVNSFADFYFGDHFNGGGNDLSFFQYLQYMESMKDGAPLSDLIAEQLAAVKAQSATLDQDLQKQVKTDNTKMLEAFDELQKAVILLKVDMMQALSISVDYVDSDGD